MSTGVEEKNDEIVVPRKVKRGATWRKKKRQKKNEVVCPSGEKCLLKQLDIADIIEAGLINDLDMFSKKLFPQKLDPAGNPIEEEEAEDSIWSLLADDEKRTFFFNLMNKLIVLGVADPVVKMSEEGLEEEEISVEWIELNDRMFLFNVLMEPINKIAPFRGEQATSVVPVETGPSL